MKYICKEATLDLNLAGWKVRLWIDITNQDSDKESYERTERIVTEYLQSEGAKTENMIMDYMATNILHLNAVQVIKERINHAKWGVVGYTTSFKDDVHG